MVATSEQEAEELAAGGIPRTRITLRRNGVEAPRSWPERGAFRRAQGISAEEKVILFLGRLSSKKSPDLLLKAFAELSRRSNGIPTTLVLAGPDESGMRAKLEEMAEQLGVRTRTRFSGPVFGDAKWAAYRDADVFVLP